MYRSVRMYKYPILICALLSPLTATTYAADAEQPPVVSRVHPLLHVQGYTFRDANGNGRLDPYEDWRLSAEQRSADLVARMTLREKAGMMMIDTFRVAPQGAIRQEDAALIREQHMTRFIFRNPVVSQPLRYQSADAARGGRGAKSGTGDGGANPPRHSGAV
ncbi:hypothetical protein AABD60_00085 [Edwardsiella piscicida]|uniref:hypothetical protein n=1 Tax=Edwardsiella piscicida TaxID=1263550 RepID=UPI00370D055B